ncbi:P-loop NTPase fold protein [Candidatus Nitrotoga fabula]|uniref:KAP family P-loop domain protein n=1 Tax=Candidatus Nitrotoga fabula TaxID=2182327 RepID=A0A916BEC4_9PROT|nr:P-loop NTPase fold protein [Candidatus Nitrotoga fabula]CAE6728982.1 Putative KAP family P-loop domain protein [Candidatus Nitrotoga fabula]
MNTYERVKEKLEILLSDTDRKVIALTGLWGIGKTYLWEDLRKTADKKFKSATYISIFGAKNIEEVKTRILKNVYFDDTRDSKNLIAKCKVWGNTIKSFVTKSKLGKIANSAAIKFSGISLAEASLILLPTLVKNKLIVIDDIERCGKTLKVGELMGFLNEYSESYQNQFLILLNTDKLHEPGKWKELHEKVIDAEVVLNPTSKECFEKAKGHANFVQEKAVIDAIEILEIQNIRVIKRIITHVKEIADKFDVQNLPTQCWVPSIVLLTAISFRAVENLPTIEYVRSYSRVRNLMVPSNSAETNNPNGIKWSMLLSRLELSYAGDFEIIFADYLETGLLEEDKLKNFFAIQNDEAKNKAAINKKNDFLNSVQWDSHTSDSELLETAKSLMEFIPDMTLKSNHQIYEAIMDLGGIDLADDYISQWEEHLGSPAFKMKEVPVSGLDNLPPKISQKIMKLREDAFPPLDLYEAIRQIEFGDISSNRVQKTLAQSTKCQYIEKLKILDKNQLRSFFKVHFDLMRTNSLIQDFEAGINNFRDACSDIVKFEKDSRLAKIITKAFDDNGLNLDSLLGGIEASERC